MRYSYKNGAAAVAVIVVVAAIGVGGFLFSSNPRTGHSRWQFWRSSPSQVAQGKEDNAEAQKKKEEEIRARVAAESQRMVAAAQESAVAADIAAAKTVEAVNGGQGAKEAGTTKVLTGQTVAQLNTATERTVDPDRIVQLEKMVTGLNQGLESANRSLQLMQDQFRAAVDDRTELKTKLAAQELKTSKAEEEAKEANAKARAWGEERDAVAAQFERLKFGFVTVIVIVVVLWLSSIILPLAAKVFPALRAPAALIGAVWAPGVQSVASGARKLSADLVAVNEYIKDELSEKLSEQELETLKKKVGDWWGSDHKSQAAIEQIKTEELRK